MNNNNLKNIILIRPGGIGDVFLAIPVLISLNKYYGNPNITLISNFNQTGVSSPVSLLFKLNLINNYYQLDVKKNKFNQFLDLFYFIKRFKNKFEISICLRHSNRSFISKFIDYIFFKNLLNIKYGFGFWNSSDLSFKIENNDYVYMIKESERLNSILRSEGMDLDYIDNLTMSKYVALKLSDVDISYKINFKSKYIVLCPFGKPFKGKFDKNWNIDNYIFVCSEIIKRGFNVFIIGGSDDISKSLMIGDKLGPNSVNLCGKVDLLELSLIIKNAQFYLGNDTGPMHISSMVGTKIAAVFNSFNNVNKFYPTGNYLIFRNPKSVKLINKDDVLSKLKLNKYI